MTPWHIIAVRSVGATAWDALPTACEHPDVVPAMVAAGHVVSRVRTAGGRETLEVREV